MRRARWAQRKHIATILNEVILCIVTTSLKPMNNTPDSDYKTIFAHPEMVVDIITGFAPGPWLNDIDFATLEPFKSSFVSTAEDPEQRHSDLVWRVRHKGTWLYVYLLFEFQSTIDPFMAIRMQVYVGLLYQDLIKNKEWGPDGKLPFILPIVLYNGNPRWRVPLATQDLISAAPDGFEHYVPRLNYFLIDEGSYSTEYLGDLENLAAAIFLIENQSSVEGLRKALDKVLKWSDRDKHEALRGAIAKLAMRVLTRRLPGGTVKLDGIHDLEGVCSMLEENIDNMILDSWHQGEQKGMLQVLRAMLVNRFGPIPDWALAKIDSATSAQLAQWCVQLLHVSTLEDLFVE
jgi:Putative transposase, YhgA-like